MGHRSAHPEAVSVRALARREGIYETEITRILRLAFLAPTIVEAILDGRQPQGVTVERLKRLPPLPSDWEDQEKMLGNLR